MFVSLELDAENPLALPALLFQLKMDQEDVSFFGSSTLAIGFSLRFRVVKLLFQLRFFL